MVASGMRVHLCRLGVLLALGLLASGSSCYDSKDHGPSSPATLSALKLATDGDQTSMAADGISRLRIIATLQGADLDKRTVVFSTSAGTLLGGRDDSNGGKEVDADVNGRATIELQSSNQVEQAVVAAAVKSVAGLVQQVVITFTAADPDSVIQIVAAPASAPADGATLSVVRVRISPSFPLGTPVTFTTSLGQFARNGMASVEVPVDGSFEATAQLQSPATLGTARVSAQAGSVSRETLVAFERALPNLITVATANAQVSAAADSSVTVTATFLRDIGAVSSGTVATFIATDDTGAALGSFRNVTVVSQATPNVATADFSPGTTAFRGQATVTVGAAGSSVKATATVEVIDP